MARTRDPQQKIALIKKAAADIIIEHGPDALTHRAVAARAEVALGTTTKYFATSDELRKAALAFLAAEVEHDLEDLQSRMSGSDAPVEVIVGELVKILSDERAVQRECCLIFAGVFNEELREISMVWAEGATAVMEEHFTKTQMYAIAHYIDGLFMGVAQTGLVPDESELRTVINALAAIEGDE